MSGPVFQVTLCCKLSVKDGLCGFFYIQDKFMGSSASTLLGMPLGPKSEMAELDAPLRTPLHFSFYRQVSRMSSTNKESIQVCTAS